MILASGGIRLNICSSVNVSPEGLCEDIANLFAHLNLSALQISFRIQKRAEMFGCLGRAKVGYRVCRKTITAEVRRSEYLMKDKKVFVQQN